MFLWERRTHKLMMLVCFFLFIMRVRREKKIHLVLSGSESENLPDICWPTLSGCLSVTPSNSGILLNSPSPARQCQSSCISVAPEERWRDGPPWNKQSRGLWPAEDLKTTIKPTKKPIFFLLSPWQAILNNVTNKLFLTDPLKNLL